MRCTAVLAWVSQCCIVALVSVSLQGTAAADMPEVVTVTVVDDGARPVFGAIVEAVTSNGARILGHTDRNGVFDASASPGERLEAAPVRPSPIAKLGKAQRCGSSSVFGVHRHDRTRHNRRRARAGQPHDGRVRIRLPLADTDARARQPPCSRRPLRRQRDVRSHARLQQFRRDTIVLGISVRGRFRRAGLESRLWLCVALSDGERDQGFSAGFSGEHSSGIRSSERLELGYRVERGHDSAGAFLAGRHVSGTFGGSFVEANAFVMKRIAGIDGRISVSATQAQTEEAGYAASYVLEPPQTANLVCSPGTATVVGPADTGGTHPRAKTIVLSLATRGGLTTRWESVRTRNRSSVPHSS